MNFYPKWQGALQTSKLKKSKLNLILTKKILSRKIVPKQPALIHSNGSQTDRRSRDYYVTTKISRIDRLPYFLSHGAPLAGFARRLRYNSLKSKMAASDSFASWSKCRFSETSMLECPSLPRI